MCFIEVGTFKNKKKLLANLKQNFRKFLRNKKKKQIKIMVR